MTRKEIVREARGFDVAAAIDLLREIISRTDALVHATEHQLERFTWSGDDDEADEGSHRRLEHLAHLLGAAKEAAQAAVAAGDQIAEALAKRRVSA